MASRLLQEACKVPWKLEPLPPKAPAQEGPAPKGAAVPCPLHGGLRRERTSRERTSSQ